MSKQKSLGDLQAELGEIETKLFPLYAAQEEANGERTLYAHAQESARGAALTDVVLMYEKADAEVKTITKSLAPLQARSAELRRDIAVIQRSEQIKRLQAAASQRRHLAEAAEAKFAEFVTAIGALAQNDRAITSSVGTDEANSFRKDCLSGIGPWITRKLREAGLSDVAPQMTWTGEEAQGTSPVESAELVNQVVETTR
jgi:hypothetical protein